MRFVRRALLAIVAVLVGLPMVAVVVLFGALNTDPGRRLAERAVVHFTDGAVTVAGLAGRFPDALRVARLEVRDDKGTWLTAEKIALDWMPSRLLSREARVTRLAADVLSVCPAADIQVQTAIATEQTRRRETASLGGVVDALHVARLHVAAPVAGAEAEFAAEGSGTLVSLAAGSADLTVRRADAAGTYRVHGSVGETSVAATLDAEEPAHGFAAALADLPEVGALSLHATVDGPWFGIATHLALTAGALTAAADGKVNFSGETADLDVAAHAPAMAPRADLAWQAVQMEAHVHGPWSGPQAKGTVAIDGLTAGGASLRKLSAQLAGDLGRVSVDATAEELSVPGPAPELFSKTPIKLRAEAQLDDPARPVTFTVSHPLLSLTGKAITAGDMSATAHLDLPDFAPLAALGAPPLAGHVALDLTAKLPPTGPSLTADGILSVTGGPAPLPQLLGPAARVAIAAALHGDSIEVSRLQLDGQSIAVTAHGSVADAIDVAWQVSLPDLSIVAPAVKGDAQAQGRVYGPLAKFAAEGTVTGTVATAQVPRGPVKLTIAAHGLPDAPSATVAAEGSFDGAPLALDATAERSADGTLALGIRRADWKSLHAEGALTLAQAAQMPAGRITLRMERLADLSGLAGQPMSGSLTAEVAAEGRQVRMTANARNTGSAGAARVGNAAIDFRVSDPLTTPAIDGSLELSGLDMSGIGGTARLQVKGSADALALQLRSTLTGLGDAPLTATAAARVTAADAGATVSAAQVEWHGETLRLLGPARLDARDGVRIDRARFGLRDAVLDVAGKFSPTLDLTATLRGLPVDLVSVMQPDLKPLGVVQADARLTGPPDRPEGRLHLAATGLHLRSGPASAMPPASVVADATLAGGAAQLTAKISAGPNDISLSGSAPLDPAGALNLRASGSADLAALDPLLAAAGRRARGQVTLDATVTGTPAQPRAGGTLRLANGDVQDIAAGLHISGIEALVEGSGDTVRLVRLTGRAGPGTIAASGSVGLAGTMPVEMTLTAKNARPLASDLLTASLDIDLALRGEALGPVALSGSVTVNRAEIRVPENLPAKVAVLDVRRPGQAPPPVVAPPDIGLNVTLRAPGQVFVRGRGLFAELQGRITIVGSMAALQPSGRFTLRRGSFNLAGQTLTFTSGDIGFDAGNGLDPTLNLVATSSTAAVAATLTVTGTASAPKIKLSSVPDLPQDEILAQLLFHQASGSLNGLQLAQAAAALAQISGVGGGFDPLNSIRQRLGLDRLAVGSAPTGTGASLEAGRYVAPGVYVGARQGSGNSGTQATVQIDLTRRLKLQATAGTGGSQSATGATSTSESNGSSLGLTYQFEY